jgi:hypothetical protein
MIVRPSRMRHPTVPTRSPPFASSLRGASLNLASGRGADVDHAQGLHGSRRARCACATCSSQDHSVTFTTSATAGSIAHRDRCAGHPGVSYPRYIGGERNGPPEDCGGIPPKRSLILLIASMPISENGQATMIPLCSIIHIPIKDAPVASQIAASRQGVSRQKSTPPPPPDRRKNSPRPLPDGYRILVLFL